MDGWIDEDGMEMEAVKRPLIDSVRDEDGRAEESGSQAGWLVAGGRIQEQRGQTWETTSLEQGHGTRTLVPDRASRRAEGAQFKSFQGVGGSGTDGLVDSSATPGLADRGARCIG